MIYLGGIVLFLLGVWIFYKMLKKKKRTGKYSEFMLVIVATLLFSGMAVFIGKAAIDAGYYETELIEVSVLEIRLEKDDSFFRGRKCLYPDVYVSTRCMDNIVVTKEKGEMEVYDPVYVMLTENDRYLVEYNAKRNTIVKVKERIGVIE